VGCRRQFRAAALSIAGRAPQRSGAATFRREDRSRPRVAGIEQPEQVRHPARAHGGVGEDERHRRIDREGAGQHRGDGIAFRKTRFVEHGLGLDRDQAACWAAASRS
jgi:hypothetical protein